MGSKHFLSNPQVSPGSSRLLFFCLIRPLHTGSSAGLLFGNPTKPISTLRLVSLKRPRLASLRPVMIKRAVHVERQEVDNVVPERLSLLREKLKNEGIICDSCTPGQYSNMLCPKCEGGSTRERSFSLFIREDGSMALWTCFRGKCGWRGHIQASSNASYAPAERNEKKQINGDLNSKKKPSRVLTEKSLGLEPLCPEILAYFSERMISPETLRRNGVMQRKMSDQNVIAFPYRRDGRIVNCKYRDIEKNFFQERDTERVLYGLDDIKNASDIIIVEGEMDKLSMEEVGYLNCVSVPDGAPAKVSEKELPPIEKDTKYQFLWKYKEYFQKASRIILATDADVPGQSLAEELARRVGRERCWRVSWPKKNEIEVCKDANEVLMHLGPQALRDVIENAELYPIRGLFRFDDYFDEIDAYYHRILGNELGVSTGWRSLDDLYNVVPGELTIVTGVPNSGKSEWIDALICNINAREGWTFALCSMENKVREHARKLLEKHIKKPFFENSRYGDSIPRMSRDELREGKQWLSDTFHLIRYEDDSLPSIKWVIDLAKAAVLRYGVRGLVIDPYNELDHQRPPNQTETEYVSQMLTLVKRFAQHHQCHVWFVAHPRQLQNWNGGAPNLYDISGSAHFINKCDNGIVVHRNRDPDAGPLDRVQICVRKVRNKVSGNIGDAFLSYRRTTGEFKDVVEGH
ncbi:hypothetical protein AMTR_s00032p00034370 [Amborella trichopoda]|uniref:SF4 helicase domain-containing protein n=2 Tax=Amborella trichopoda TaxID=13333 RepID=U5D333_AMBTC|nr:hypothetical protein AMTR_s00032p00034370 [Amborella trichopoda]